LFAKVKTSSLNTQKGAILEMAVIVDNCEEYDVVPQAYTWNASPFFGADVSHDALLVNGMTLEEVNAFPHEKSMLKTFTDLLSQGCDRFKKVKRLADKYFLLSYNVTFDGNFIRSLFVRNGNNFFGSHFWQPPVCIMQMAAAELMLERDKLKGFRMSDVAEYLGVGGSEEGMSSALEDVATARGIFYALLARHNA
jgi:hypothetical protein